MKNLTIVLFMYLFCVCGCASQKSFSPILSRPFAAMTIPIPRMPERIVDKASQVKNVAKQLATEVVAIPLAPFTFLQVMHAYDKAEREGGILP